MRISLFFCHASFNCVDMLTVVYSRSKMQPGSSTMIMIMIIQEPTRVLLLALETPVLPLFLLPQLFYFEGPLTCHN